MPVLVAVAETHHAAVVEPHAARALHLQEECVDRIVDPEQFLARKQIAAGDLATARVGNHALPLQLAAQAQVCQLRMHAAEIDHEQVLRHAVNGRGKALAARAAAAQQRLVVTGHQPAVARVQLAIALDASREHSIGVEAGREERSDRGGAASIDTFGTTADFAPRVALAERTAALQECRPGSDPVIGTRGRQHFEHDRLVKRAGLGRRSCRRCRRRRRRHGPWRRGGPDGAAGERCDRQDGREVTARIHGQRECRHVADSARSGARTCGAAVHRLVDDVRQAAPQESARPLVQCSVLGIDSTNSGIGTSNAVPSSAMHW